MSILNQNTKEAIYEYFDKVIYPEQFQSKGRTARLQNHIIQIVKGHNLPKATALILLRRYVNPDFTKEQVLEASADYNQSWKSICNYDYFTKAIEILDDKAFEYYTGSGNNTHRRTIRPIEYRFVLNKLSTIIYKNLENGGKSGVSYNYFLKKSSGIMDDYKKVCHRSISRHKLAHIFKHLEHHQLIHRVGNAKNSYDYHIGPANPMYALSIVPDLDDSELNQVNLLTAREHEYQNAFIALQAELKDKDAEIAELKKRLADRPTTPSEPQPEPHPEPKPEKTLSEIEITKQAELLEREILAGQNIEQEQESTFLSSMGIMDDGTVMTSKRERIPYDYFPDE